MHFNPHSHEGSDASCIPFRYAIAISIHTPMKGVTKPTKGGRHVINYFNPHSHEGSDVAVARYNHTYSQDFNPHSHEGSDKKIGVKGNLVNISIHTPMKGVTSVWMSDNFEFGNFNPHSHEGSDSNFVQFRTFIF